MTIMVSSLARSMPYYDALLPLLGFRKRHDHVWTDDEGFALQFLRAAEGARPYERYGAGMNHIGFDARARQQVLRVRAAMQDAGFDVPEVQETEGAVSLFMKDPDGIRFEVSWYPEGVSAVD